MEPDDEYPIPTVFDGEVVESIDDDFGLMYIGTDEHITNILCNCSDPSVKKALREIFPGAKEVFVGSEYPGADYYLGDTIQISE